MEASRGKVTVFHPPPGHVGPGCVALDTLALDTLALDALAPDALAPDAHQLDHVFYIVNSALKKKGISVYRFLFK